MNNQFFGFSPEAFEQFVRALSLSVFGPGVTAFGNGPDGGREATFQGKVPYPYPPSTQWDGYGVIQAKCKEKIESTKKDQDWALGLLEDELKTFMKSEKRQPKPEYFVFVTNVDLSSVAVGGKDKAEKILQSFYRKLPLKGHAVWDANQLNALLAKHEEIRRRFREFLTPGDILSAMLDEIEKKQPNVTRILTTFLERELRADESSRLDQAGNRTDEQLRLAKLFFDLPASPQAQLVPPEEGSDSQGRLPRGVLWEMLRDGSRKLDPKTLYEQETLSSDDPNKQFPTRYILIGGPGSGKSTLGQFLAQIHRSALLKRSEQHLLQQQTRDIIMETYKLCEREDLPWPLTPRYPFRVELNRFSKALATQQTDKIKSLSGYLLSSLKGENILTHDSLLEWLATYPWLLILDGLDEVPATSNRRDVVKAVDDFLSEARQVGADLFVVATSRQQGYAGEFSRGTVAIRHVLPLSPVRALRYVERYVNARFGTSDPNKAKDIVDKLRQSSKRLLTAQLMGSPLQVTFMATVVAARGDPGEDRWQLFESYYSTIYDRERQKAVSPYDAVLSKQKTTIDRLHHDIGFWLQYNGEVAGGAAVNLSINVFERLVDNYLSEIGREGSEKEEMVKLITDAARHRLVFLTSRLAGELSFDVRSLQEYMAAECIMTGSPDVVTSRLKSIATSPYWRNVFLFAASKCFTDARSRYLQDAIRLLCEDMNSSKDLFLSATKAGSELAIDILQSGAVSENPNHSRHLAHIGLKLLCRPYLIHGNEEGPALDYHLLLIYRDFLESVYREDIQLHIGQTEVSRTLGAWPLLIRLCEKGINWTSDLFEKYWPSDPTRIMAMAQVFSNLGFIPFLRRKIEEVLPKMSTSEAFSISNFFCYSKDFPGLINTLSTFNVFEILIVEIPLRVTGAEEEGCKFQIIPIRNRGKKSTDIYKEFLRMKNPHPSWLPFVFADEFLESPTPNTLANILNKCADGGWKPYEKNNIECLPWPMARCLEDAQKPDDLRVIAQNLQKGALGTMEDWIGDEERWISEGITLSEIVNKTKCLIPFEGLSYKGFLFTFFGCSIKHRKYSNSFIQKILRAAQEMPPGKFKQYIIWFMFAVGSYKDRLSDLIKPSQLRSLLEKSEDKVIWSQNLIKHPEDSKKVGSWLDFFEWLGNSNRLSPFYSSHLFFEKSHYDDWCDTFQKAFTSSVTQYPYSHPNEEIKIPVKLGILRLLGRLASNGYNMNLIPLEMLKLTGFSEPRFKLAALLASLAHPNLSESLSRDLADEAISLLEPTAEDGADHLIFKTIEAHINKNPAISEFILELREKMPEKVNLGIAKCDRLLRLVVRNRASSLQSREELQKLQLPFIE